MSKKFYEFVMSLVVIAIALAVIAVPVIAGYKLWGNFMFLFFSIGLMLPGMALKERDGVLATLFFAIFYAGCVWVVFF